MDASAELVDLISALEDLNAAAAAAQARAAVDLDRTRRAQEAAIGVRAERRGRGVAAEVGLAARVSAAQGSTLLGFGKALCTEMPFTLAALAHGRLSKWRATLLVKESACLTVEDRVRLDKDLCADPSVLEGLGDRRVGDAARAWCCREDAAAVVARRRRAESERRVSIRPAPDSMTYLTALLPVAEGVAAYKALTTAADSARARGDERTRGQVMADVLVAGVTGLPEGSCPPVLVNLVMTDRALFSGDDEPAVVPGYGPVPAADARSLVVRSQRNGAGAWVRRLYTAPSTNSLVAMDSRRRKAPRGLSDLIDLRDGASCRAPWCDAPARHDDHVVPHAEGGKTTHVNTQRDCEAHNYAKIAPGWKAEPVAGERHRVVTTTPTGHTYSSTAPPLPGWQPQHTAGPQEQVAATDAAPPPRAPDEAAHAGTAGSVRAGGGECGCASSCGCECASTTRLSEGERILRRDLSWVRAA